MKSFDRPKSLTELVTETLREWIISGELDLGSQLSEARVAKELDVSRTPVREAINRLEMEGMLVVEPQRGTYVFNLEADELVKLCDARVCLETNALTTAIHAKPEALHARLSDCVNRMKAARDKGDDSAYLALDTEFHQHFFDCSDNRFLDEAYQTIAQKMAAVRNRLGRHPEHMAKSFREHGVLVQAVADRDLDTAIATLRSHIDRKEGSYWEIVTKPAAEQT
ncbi:GntR family transcriptional regulator [uncultured Sulfitobacter sp.]|jgi:DNA-binding GntR family transcriptional regulator|uniref:GntR family transcriptional regulator n=1 Tax=Sulfitobacter sp. SH22 TaxID=3421172 RepID=UPI0025F388B5|nr:GntR family transcriptional regulator [uncultured Sulfitobacter sp.]